MTAATAKSKREAAKAAKADDDGAKADDGLPVDELYQGILDSLRAAKAGDVDPHPKGIYARLRDGKRTFGYVVPRKRNLLVYPCTLASAMPDGLSFTQVELGKHHYGRGEVIVAVDGPDDFADAVRALEAARANPIPRAEKAGA